MMLKPTLKMINPYYHPTTVVFLDDHQPFLDSIPLALEANTLYQTFSDPKQAIEYINDHTQYHSLLKKDSLYDSSYHYKFDTNSILDMTLDHQRFSEPSILITDYAMLGSDYNGLDVCQAIDNPYVKKILLTGVADEQVAIEALNNKVIDYYLKKSTQDILPQINELINRYQQAYFRDMTRVVREGLKLTSPLIDDPAIVGYFFSLIEQENIVEYHLSTEFSPASLDFIMLDKEGKNHRLLLLNQDDIKAHKDVAIDAEAPVELLKVFETLASLPLFPSFDGFYHPNLEANWKEYLYPCRKIHGENLYLATLIQTTTSGTPYIRNTQPEPSQKHTKIDTITNSVN
ncbi:hypothetical protein MSP8887_03448 [Marinomonas spartinae]|uniref:response regulator transcription factor n=1 Tax=Marinomonas spartinae TaxID=1792290 RepID=UPI000808CFED|nr:response regulator [Marinomonas spartinae]SBS38706.1 hypothetical protein MSP8887_03448 [Marinomonas spartinae]